MKNKKGYNFLLLKISCILYMLKFQKPIEHNKKCRVFFFVVRHTKKSGENNI